MPNKPPIVSILTPTYNHGKYLEECISSVLNQSFEHWEMLILDDGSTDDTPVIAERYAAQDSRIHYYRQENVGIFRLSETYNKGLHLASGEFIAILEGDDYWVSEKLQLQMEYLQLHPECILSWGQAYSVSSDRQSIYGLNPEINTDLIPLFNNTPTGNILNIFFFRNCIPALTLMIRKNALLSINGFKQPYNLPLVDLPTLYELATLGEFYFIPKVLGSWRIYASQITKTYTAEIMEGFTSLAFDNYLKYSENKDLHLSVDFKVLKKHYTCQKIITYSRAGRYKLIRRDFRNARHAYIVSMVTGGYTEPVWKLRSLVGIVFSFLHLNVEGLSKVLGKKHYSTE